MKINTIEQTHTIHHEAVYDADNNLISEAYDEPIYEAVTREMSPEEEAEYLSQQNSPEAVQMEIEQLKEQLAQSDYRAIKHSEGLISDEDYAPIKAEREAIREQIRELEGRV